MLKHFLYLLALFLLFPVLVHGDELISVSLGSQKMPMPAGRLDFGLLGGADTASAVLTVTNLSTKSLVLDVFGFGNNVRAVWQKDPSSKPPCTRIELLSQQRASLKIEVTPGGPPGTYTTKRGEARTWENDGWYPVVTISNGAAIATIQIAYVEVAFTFPYDNKLWSDSLPSGLGEWWSPVYNLCLVAAQPHFRLRPGSAHVDLSSENPAHERSCGRWAICTIYKQDDSEVCVHIQVQGHHESDGSKDGHNEVVMFHFTLSASYDFIPQPPPVLGEAFK
jgi:hypothetical protein